MSAFQSIVIKSTAVLARDARAGGQPATVSGLRLADAGNGLSQFCSSYTAAVSRGVLDDAAQAACDALARGQPHPGGSSVAA